MSLPEVLDNLRRNHDFMSQVVAWERIPARDGRTTPIPPALDPRLTAALASQGVTQLYQHQTAAVEKVLAGQNLIVATSTASGKSLCYTLPVLHTLLGQVHGRALYLFPTKALAHDQLAATQALISAGRLPITAHSYDGDTPTGQRAKIRKNSHILFSNPDMLHAGILPFHPSWRDFFRQLRYVVIDEIHAYRGVFGSHVANVLRRLQRLCAFYGATPQFICCSATIANPQEHAERLVERPFALIDEADNGAPRGPRHFIMYNPPIIDEELGLRRSSVLAAKDAAATFILREVQTAVFARARQTVEILLRYLQDELAYHDLPPDMITGYRSGYLPLERRQIEQGLRTGEVRGVVATNALELGVDIGELEAVVLTGFPGSIASLWQQAGRAGRRAGEAAAVLIASSNPLDQYIARHPRYLFGRSPEHALINPDNERLMVQHVACAAFELPFVAGEHYGGYGPADDLLAAMAEMQLLHHTGQQYHYLGDGDQPASKVSLRTSGHDTVVIQAVTAEGVRVLGEVDLDSAPLMVHEGAIYLHQAQPYQVDKLDWDGRIAYVKLVEVDYYTRASIGSDIQALRPTAEQTLRNPKSQTQTLKAYGEVRVVTQATNYRKIRHYTHETLGYGPITLPPLELETHGFWLIFGQTLTEQLYDEGILLRPNDYGPTWATQRKLALERDGHTCRTCGTSATQQGGERVVLHVHHIRPFREYGYVRGQNNYDRHANHVDNLVTLCPSCHRRAEQGQQARSALGGLAYVWRNLAPLFLMCDPSDIEVTAESQNPLTAAPTIVVYERVAAGLGFSERLYALHDELLAAAAELITTCTCKEGCPACVGPPGEIGPDTKAVTLRLVNLLGTMENGEV